MQLPSLSVEVLEAHVVPVYPFFYFSFHFVFLYLVEVDVSSKIVETELAFNLVPFLILYVNCVLLN